MLSKIPVAPSAIASDEPPWLTKTNGRPVSGKKPVIAAILIKVCTAISITIPEASSLANKSGDLEAINKPLDRKNTKSKISTTLPIKPNSSAKTAKIESPIGSVRYWNFCMLMPNPLQNKPPDPIVIKDWFSW